MYSISLCLSEGSIYVCFPMDQMHSAFFTFAAVKVFFWLKQNSGKSAFRNFYFLCYNKGLIGLQATDTLACLEENLHFTVTSGIPSPKDYS